MVSPSLPASLSRTQVADALGLFHVMARGGDELGDVLASILPSEVRGAHPLLALIALKVEGPLRPAQISERTGLTSGGTTRLIDRLEASGLVAREYGRVPGDRRGSIVTLSDAGDRALEQGALAIRASAPAIARVAASLGSFLASLERADR